MTSRSALRAVSLLACSVGQFLGPRPVSCQLPWEYYRRHSLAEVISQQHDIVLRTFTQELGQRIFLGGSSFPSLPDLRYLDSARATSGRRLELIRLWIKTYEIPDESPDDYTTELLFREEDRQLWLPVRSSVIEGLESAAASGDPLTLYVVWVGALKTGDDIEWVFLVYGFQPERPGTCADGGQFVCPRDS